MKAWIPREMPPSSCFCLLNIWGPECELSARSLSSPILKTWACLLRIDVFYKIDWQINWSAEFFCSFATNRLWFVADLLVHCVGARARLALSLLRINSPEGLRSLCHSCAYQINSIILCVRLNCELVCTLPSCHNRKLLG